MNRIPLQRNGIRFMTPLRWQRPAVAGGGAAAQGRNGASSRSSFGLGIAPMIVLTISPPT